MNAIEVSERLARDAGVVTLPAEFFCKEKAMAVDSVSAGDDGMWLRFSVANVDDEKVRKVCERLSECETSLGWEVES